VHERVLVAGEADVADFARLLGRHNGFVRAALSEVAVGIFEPDVFVKLDEINDIDLKAAEGFIDVPGGSLARTAIELGHQKDAFAVTIAERLAHEDFALAGVIVAGVIEEGEAAIYSASDDADALVLVLRYTDMEATEPDGGHLFAGRAELAVDHTVRTRGFERSRQLHRRKTSEKFTSFH